jgi:glycosyltransferase involved in cell wall biosynthesis
VISIITPTHNRPQRLLRAIRSVQSQDYPDWEMIVVDDGDGSGLEAALALGDVQVYGLMNPGSGQTDARNAALGMTSGDVIALLDDDDWWEDAHHLHRVLSALRNGPALTYRGGWLVFERDGLELQRLPYTLTASPASLHHDNALLASGVAYPKVMHDQLGLFDPNLGHYWDWDWYLRVVRAGYALRPILTPGVAIAVHAGNASGPDQEISRTRDLRALCAKHGLGELPLKNHVSLVTTEQPRIQPEPVLH